MAPCVQILMNVTSTMGDVPISVRILWDRSNVLAGLDSPCLRMASHVTVSLIAEYFTAKEFPQCSGNL